MAWQAPATAGSYRDGSWSYDRIVQEAASIAQPWYFNNAALKYFRHMHENPPGVPTVAEVAIPMDQLTVDFQMCDHDAKGVGFTFLHGAWHPWSWRAFVRELGPEKGAELVGAGLVSVSVFARPNSYDHHRAHADKTTLPHTATVDGGAIGVSFRRVLCRRSGTSSSLGAMARWCWCTLGGSQRRRGSLTS